MKGIARCAGKAGPEKKDAQDQADAYERCVCCHRRVGILKDTDIEFRPFYVEGVGQDATMNYMCGMQASDAGPGFCPGTLLFVQCCANLEAPAAFPRLCLCL